MVVDVAGVVGADLNFSVGRERRELINPIHFGPCLLGSRKRKRSFEHVGDSEPAVLDTLADADGGMVPVVLRIRGNSVASRR